MRVRQRQPPLYVPVKGIPVINGRTAELAGRTGSVAWASLIDGDAPAIELCPVKRADCLVGCPRIGHVDEPEASRTPGELVLRDADR